MSCGKHEWQWKTDCPYCVDESSQEERDAYLSAKGEQLRQESDNDILKDLKFKEYNGEELLTRSPLPKVSFRCFDTGATRSPLADKLQYSGFISPIVLKRYAEYMHKHRLQENGELRDADNWQKGIPDASALDSMLRHTMDVWLHQRGFELEMTETLLESLCAVIFNASVMILNLKRKDENTDNTTNNVQV